MAIIPEQTSLTAPYWESARSGRIEVQECTQCGWRWHPPQPACPKCRCIELRWMPTSTVGKVTSYTVVRHAAHGAVAGSLPYVVALVELEPEVVVICNIVDVDAAAVRVGEEVDIRLGASPAGTELPQAFRRRRR